MNTDFALARKEIGLLVKEQRERLGKSQVELAEELGYRSKSTICKIEAGVNDIPRDRIIDFANALNVPPHYFIYSDVSQNEKETTINNLLYVKTQFAVDTNCKDEYNQLITLMGLIDDIRKKGKLSELLSYTRYLAN